jgi:accessory gene regulator B
MVQQLAVKTAEKMSKYGVIEEKSCRICAYGLELFFSSLAGVVVLIFLSAVQGNPHSWIPYLAGFVPLRLSGGGYHAKTHFRCIFTFSLLYLLVLTIGHSFPIPAAVWPVICLINLAIIFLFSPVEASNKPLKVSQSTTNRRKSLFLGVINLFGCIASLFLQSAHSQWVNMYFSGSSIAGLSMLLAVINNSNVERRRLHEKVG